MIPFYRTGPMWGPFLAVESDSFSNSVAPSMWAHSHSIRSMKIDLDSSGAPNPSDVARVVLLNPDPSILSAIGRSHNLVSAVADIIDNSIDAAADSVRITFVVDDGWVRRVRIRDNGRGMNAAGLERAMSLGARREYDEQDLGFFGMGLKAASLSQADTLTVYASDGTNRAAGMRIRRPTANPTFDAEVLLDLAAQRGFDFDASEIERASTGTVVEWSGLESFSSSRSPEIRSRGLQESMMNLAHELGLIFHRLIAKRSLRIQICRLDESIGLGAPLTVAALNPFDFIVWGATGYPTRISGEIGNGESVGVTCYILPPFSKSPSALIMGKQRREWQGFYVYRHDRLLHWATWLGLESEQKLDLQLARVVLDLDDVPDGLVSINPEKRGVVFAPDFVEAIESGTDSSGRSFRNFLDDAQQVMKNANTRERKLKPLAPISTGLPADVLESIAETFGTRPGESAIKLAWKMMSSDKFFEFDLSSRAVWLNAGYRAKLEGDYGGAELTLALIYLLVEEKFSKTWLQQITLEQFDGWQAILITALGSDLGPDSFDSGALDEDESGLLPFALEEASSDLETHTPDRLAFDDSLPWNQEIFDEDGDTEDAGAQDLVEVRQRQVRVSPADIARRQPQRLPAKISEPAEHLPTADIVSSYAQGHTLGEIASQYLVDERAVVTILSEVLLGFGSNMDDETLAARNGLTYEPGERERILTAYKRGNAVERVANDLQRTPFAIAWQLFASPQRPIAIPRSLLRRLRRAEAGGQSAGAPIKPDGDTSWPAKLRSS